MKIVTLQHNKKAGVYLMSIPKKFIDELGWKAGDSLKVDRPGDVLVVQKIEP